MRRPTLGAAALAAGALVTAAPAAAQSFGARALLAGLRTATATSPDTLLLTGTAYGLEGSAGIGPVSLAVRYLEGAVGNDSAGIDRDVAEADVTLWVRPLRWGAVGAGPHVRSFIATGSTERWVLWEARARATAAILPRLVDAYLEGWLALGGDVDVPDPFDAGRGLEGGLEVAVGRVPVSLRLRYRVERLELGDGRRQETTEHVMLGVGVGRY